MVSPRLTFSPSNTSRLRHFGISSSCCSPSSLVIMTRCLPLVSLPKEIVPDFSAKIAPSLGLRASNKSATRGKPPVMSRVLEEACGRRAITSPTSTLAPLVELTIAPAGSGYCTGILVPSKNTLSPLASSKRTVGRNSRPAVGRLRGSMISIEDKPVISSILVCTVTPSIKSLKSTRPVTSEMIG